MKYFFPNLEKVVLCGSSFVSTVPAGFGRLVEGGAGACSAAGRKEQVTGRAAWYTHMQ